MLITRLVLYTKPRAKSAQILYIQGGVFLMYFSEFHGFKLKGPADPNPLFYHLVLQLHVLILARLK